MKELCFQKLTAEGPGDCCLILTEPDCPLLSPSCDSNRVYPIGVFPSLREFPQARRTLDRKMDVGIMQNCGCPETNCDKQRVPRNSPPQLPPARPAPTVSPQSSRKRDDSDLLSTQSVN